MSSASPDAEIKEIHQAYLQSMTTLQKEADLIFKQYLQALEQKKVELTKTSFGS